MAAVRTSIAMSWSAPSASATSCRARSSADLGHGIGEVVGAGRRRPRRRRPAARRCRWSTCSRRSRPGRRWSRSRARSASSRSAAVDDGVGGEHDEHRGQRRGEHAGALGHAADRPAVALATACLATVSVVMIASAASGPPSVGQRGGGGVDAGEQQVHRQPLADQPGRADDDVAGARCRARRADVLGGARGCPGSPGRRCRRWRRRS